MPGTKNEITWQPFFGFQANSRSPRTDVLSLIAESLDEQRS